MRAPIAIAVACVVVLAAAGGGYYGLEVYPQRLFRDGLDQTLASLPPGTTGSYKTAHYALLSHKAVVTGVAIHSDIPGTTGQPIDVAIEQIEMADPNMNFSTVWAAAAAHPAAVAPDMAVPVAGVVVITGLSFHSPVATMTQASARIAKPRLYPAALLHDGLPTWRDIQAVLRTRTQPFNPDDLLPLLRAEAAAFLGTGYDSYDAGAMRVTESLPGIDISYAVRGMTAGSADRGVIASMSADGIVGGGAPFGTVSLDRMTIGPSDFRHALTPLLNGDKLSLALLDGIKIGRVDYIGMTVEVPGQPPMHAGAMSVGPLVFAQGKPVSGELAWQDVGVTKAQLKDPKVMDAFDKLDLTSVTTSFAAAYDWDLANKTATVRDTMLKVNELGTIRFSAELRDVEPADAKLVHAKLRFEDASLVDRLVRAGATQAGVDPAVFRQQIMTIARQQSTAAAAGNPAVMAAGRAFGDFIAMPRSLTIELTPPTPVSLSAFQSGKLPPGQMATMLGLTVTANQP